MKTVLRGQGATEYLVLLAVVLIIALVGIALLGFFPGTASDAQMTESKLYWQSVNPIVIIEWSARTWSGNGLTYPYLRIKNNGQYPIRITAVIGQDGGRVTTFWTSTNGACNPSSTGFWNIGDYYYMAPGEEKYFAWTGSALGGIPCDYQIQFITGATSGNSVGGATSVCRNSTTDSGYVEIKNLGFEYVTYIEGQQITKRQAGTKPVIIKCPPT